VLLELEQSGIETELVSLAGRRIAGCIACGKCKQNHDRRCAVTNDDFNGLFEKLHTADGILLGTPVHFADLTPVIKALIDRAGYVSRANDDLLKRKVGAAVVAVRRAGAIHAFDSLNHFFLIGQMIIPGSSYWNVGVGRDIGDVNQDAEGMQTMRTLGQNMAWLLARVGCA
jgi:multimeric flavodoxin WrbA